MELERLSLPAWDTLDEPAARAAVREIERRVPRAKFVGFEQHAQADQARRVAVFDVDGVAMVLVPGARTTLGFDVELLNDTASRAWSQSFREEGHLAQQVLGGPDVDKGPPSEMVSFLKASNSALREVEIAPFLLERTSPAVDEQLEADWDGDEDPHTNVARAIVAQGFRLPSSDEWEWAASGGTRAIFRWGNLWPIDTHVWDGGPFEEHKAPNAFGLVFSSNPYRSELVDDPEELRGGDGGCLVCGEAGPMAWSTFASSFRYRLKPSDDREIWFEQAYPRRALSIVPREGEGTIRIYRKPTLEESAELAADTLREALEDHEDLVLEGEERAELEGELPDLDALKRAHPLDEDVQILLSHAYRKLGRFDEAEAVIRSVIARRESGRAWVTLASVRQAQGDTQGAVTAFDRAAELDGEAGGSPDAAALLREAGRFAEAADRYEAFLARHPDVGWAEVFAAYTRFKANGDRALSAKLVAIAKGPAKGVAWIAALADEVEPGWRGRKTASKKKVGSKKKAAPKKTVASKKAAPKRKAAAKKKAAPAKKTTTRRKKVARR